MSAAAAIVLILFCLAASSRAQNSPPQFQPINDTTIAEGSQLILQVEATDLDGDSITLWAENLPANADFRQTRSGVGGLTFAPDFFQANSYSITFQASDGIDTVPKVVNIVVTNVSQPPVLDSIKAKTITEGQTLQFPVIASDADLDSIVLSASSLPAHAQFVDSGNGRGVFNWTPTYNRAGQYTVTFRAVAAGERDSEQVVITVIDAGNQAPVLDSIGSKIAVEGVRLTIDVRASDPDSTIPACSTSVLPANADFISNSDGTGRFQFTPDTTQYGVIQVTFYAVDKSVPAAILVDSEVVTITVIGPNEPPVLDSIGPQTVIEGDSLILSIAATDPNAGTYPILVATPLPDHAVFDDYQNGTGKLSFYPNCTQQGVYPVVFKAYDGEFTDSEIVTITVVDAGNQPPAVTLEPSGPYTVVEGDSISLQALVRDCESPNPTLAIEPNTLPSHARFTVTDSIGQFTFAPDCTQGDSIYHILLLGSDGELVDTVDLAIAVQDTGNWLPTLAVIGLTTVQEGRRLPIEIVTTNCEGVIDSGNIWISPPPTDPIYKENVRLTKLGGGKALFEFYPDYSQANTYPITFYAFDGVDTVFRQLFIVVDDVAKSVNDSGAADTLEIVSRNWDGQGELAVTCRIWNDFPIAAGLTGFRWSNPGLKFDRITFGPLLDSADYKLFRVLPDSLMFDAEFIFFQGRSFPPGGGLYFTVYFHDSAGTWGPESVLRLDTAKYGSSGDFVFDKRIRTMAFKDATPADLTLSSQSIYTYVPLVILGEVRYPIAADDDIHPLPNSFALEQNFPNPFNPATTIRFSLPRAGWVRLRVYNIIGQTIATLTDRDYPAGTHTVIWDGRDSAGRPAASGIYLYQIISEGITSTKKMILLR